MSLLVYHYTIVTNIIAHAGLYRQLVIRPMILLATDLLTDTLDGWLADRLTDGLTA